jgi:transposase
MIIARRRAQHRQWVLRLQGADMDPPLAGRRLAPDVGEGGVIPLMAKKAMDIEKAIGNFLLSSGLKLARLRRKTFERRVRALIAGKPFLAELVEPLLEMRAALKQRAAAYEARVIAIAKADPVCARLVSAPGISWLTAITYRTCLDEPARFTRSRNLGPHLGLTPKTLQSGERVRNGRITRWGDRSVRTALYNSARGLLRTQIRPSWLSVWGKALAARRGKKTAIIAMARRLAVVLHRMRLDNTDLRWEASSI